MDHKDNITQWLEMMGRPAFAVENDRVTHTNGEALRRLLPTGTEILPLLTTGKEEFRDLREGSLCLTLCIADRYRQAAVHRIEEGVYLFLLDHEADMQALRALGLAARMLREPLNSIVCATEHMFPELDLEEAPALLQDAASINRGTYQLQRIISNMSDVQQFVEGTISNRENTNLCSYFDELFQRAQTLLDKTGIPLEYQLPAQAVTVALDRQRMERAVYNLLSNAARFSDKCGRIRADFQVGKTQVTLRVRDEGEGLHQAVRQALFRQYHREPTLEDSRRGLGLGLVLVREVAKMHGGTLLVTPDAKGGTVAALAMERKLVDSRADRRDLRNPLLMVDYAGERDHALLELSGELPLEFYDPTLL